MAGRPEGPPLKFPRSSMFDLEDSEAYPSSPLRALYLKVELSRLPQLFFPRFNHTFHIDILIFSLKITPKTTIKKKKNYVCVYVCVNMHRKCLVGCNILLLDWTIRAIKRTFNFYSIIQINLWIFYSLLYLYSQKFFKWRKSW